MFQHIAEGLFKSYLVVTTVEKAKDARAYLEPLITLARVGGPAAQREIRRVVQDKLAYRTLFEKIRPLYADRKGGYTRIIRLGRRPGDGAEQAVLELVDREKLGPPPGKPPAGKKEAKEKVGAGTR
jgi:large subunit ribosomal protein L17